MRKLFKVGLILGVIAGLVIVGKKLMGGLGPEPGSAMAPKEWPSLVPDPPATATSTPSTPGATEVSGNGSSSNGTGDSDGEAIEPADAESTDS